jgi:hypothetical protein
LLIFYRICVAKTGAKIVPRNAWWHTFFVKKSGGRHFDYKSQWVTTKASVRRPRPTPHNFNPLNLERTQDVQQTGRQKLTHLPTIFLSIDDEYEVGFLEEPHPASLFQYSAFPTRRFHSCGQPLVRIASAIESQRQFAMQVIGAGVVGLAVARRLALRSGGSVVLLERNHAVGNRDFLP